MRMLSLLLISVLYLTVVEGLQCRFNCDINAIPFDRPFQIPDGECQQFVSAPNCSVGLQFNYDQRVYSMRFSTDSTIMRTFSISSSLSLSYIIDYGCSTNDECILTYTENQVKKIVGHNYESKKIYEQIAPLIGNTTSSSSTQCYNSAQKIVTCRMNEMCAMGYDYRAHVVQWRDCIDRPNPAVFYEEGDSASSLHVICARDLCNDDSTLERITAILVTNGLIDDHHPFSSDDQPRPLLFLITLMLLMPLLSTK